MGRRLVVGVLGGMGPEATLDFFGKLLEATPAEREQDRLRVLIDCNPTLPDRNEAVAGTGPSPGPGIAAMARGLVSAGADFLVMPCNTAHAFQPEFGPRLSVPFLSIVEETAEAVAARLQGRPGDGARAVGLLATSGTLGSGIYEDSLAQRGIESLRLDDGAQRRFMGLLYRMKRGDTSGGARTEMAGLARELLARGARLIVAACTEVPLVLSEEALGAPLVSSTDVLVKATVEVATGERSLPTGG